MNRTLYQLAYRNIKKFKKHYMIVSFIVLLMSIFFMTFMMTWSQSYEVKKTYNMEKYGTWYVWTSIDFQEKEIIEELIEKQPYSPLYGYYYHQGFDNNGKTIGYMENTLYKMCHLQLNKGRYPQNTQEIMVSSSYMNENNYHINQVISLSIQGSPITDYTIVGMIEKSQNIFPDIYTNIQGSGDIQLISDGIIGQKDLESKDKYYLYKHIDEFHQLRYTLTEVYQNEYGYDSSMQKEYIHFATEQLLVLCESCLCTAFVLVLLTSSSLKKRNQEFALLRGIGMTSRQLFLMVVYEILFTSMIAMIVGFILSIGLSYGWMLYLNTQYHVFVFKIDILKNIGLLFLLMGLVFSSLLFPIFSSTKQALSGVFGEKTFHYIQVRYHLLKKQTKLRLAYRDLISNQMLTFSTFLFICILVVFFMTLSSSPKENLQKDQTEYQNLHYTEIIVDKDNRRKVEELKAMFNETSQVYRYGTCVKEGVYKNENFNYVHILAIDDDDIFQECVIEGRRPLHPQEVLIAGDDSSLSYLSVTQVLDGTMTQLNEVSHLSIGDKLVIDEREYNIVGKIKANESLFVQGFLYDEISYIPTNGVDIVMMGEEFDKCIEESHEIIRCYSDSIQENTSLANQLSYEIENISISDGRRLPEKSENKELQITPAMYIFLTLICFVICYYVHKNYILNNYSNYALLRLIGMTRKDLLTQHFLKAVITSFCTIVVELVWFILMKFAEYRMTHSVMFLMISIVCIFIFYVIVYCLPIYLFMQVNTMEHFYRND